METHVRTRAACAHAVARAYGHARTRSMMACGRASMRQQRGPARPAPHAAVVRGQVALRCVGCKPCRTGQPLTPMPPAPHVPSAWYFYGLMALLGASLLACTSTTQWPAVKVRTQAQVRLYSRSHARSARTRALHAPPRSPTRRPGLPRPRPLLLQVAQRWRFAPDPQAVQRAAGAPAQVLPNAALPDLGAALAARGYQVFRKGGELYAFKGLAGRLGPIGVHAAMILTLLGTAYSGFGGWKGSAMVPEGQEFLVAAAISPASGISWLPPGARAVLRVNDFEIETRPDGSVAQFYSDLSLRDLDSGDELLRKRISVNDPFR